MRRLNRVLGLFVAILGVGLALWAPAGFERLTGQPLPVPAANDQAAMIAWSGVAFVRVFGAVLLAIGAALWASTTGAATRGVQLALCLSAAFAGVIVWAQQVAIWANSVGWALVALFGVLAISSGLLFLRPNERLVTERAV